MKQLPDPHARPHALELYRSKDRFNENVPHATEAEQGVLASIMIEPALWDKVVQYLDDKCFYSNNNRIIFKAMELLKKEGHDIDLITVNNKLKELGQHDNTGGSAYLAELVNKIQSSARVASFVRIVFEKWKARSIIQLSEKLSLSCIDGSFSEIIVNEFVGSIEKIFHDKTAARPYSFGENSLSVIEDIAEKERQRKLGVPYSTTIRDLDEVTGGIEKKTLSVIGAKSSIGKTSLMTQMAFGLAKQIHRVLYFTTEMPEQEIRNRIICSELDLNYFKTIRIGNITDEERERIVAFSEKTKLLQFYIYFKPSLTCQFIINEINKLNPDFVFVDYFQQMSIPGKDRTDREYTKICDEFKTIAGERNCGIIMASQFSRSMDYNDREKPRLADLKESGGIEISADLVMLLQRHKPNESEEKKTIVSYNTDIIVAKQRNGPSNVAVQTLYLTKPMKFVQIAKDYDNDKK